MAVTIGRVVYIEAAPGWGAGLPGLYVGGFQSGPVLPPVCPVWFATSSIGTPRNLLNSPTRSQVAESGVVILCLAEIGNEHFVQSHGQRAVVFHTLVFRVLVTGKSRCRFESSRTVPGQYLPVEFHVGQHLQSPYLRDNAAMLTRIICLAFVGGG